MIRLVCPSCKKDSYTASVEIFRPCPYCGIVFSGKYGCLKKEHLETNIGIHSFISHKQNVISANTHDFSEKVRIEESTKIPTTV